MEVLLLKRRMTQLEVDVRFLKDQHEEMNNLLRDLSKSGSEEVREKVETTVTRLKKRKIEYDADKKRLE